MGDEELFGWGSWGDAGEMTNETFNRANQQR